MSQVKYIVVEGSYHEMFIFGDTRQHAEVWDKFRTGHNKLVSAGFLSISNGPTGNPTVKAYGESISLNVKSDPERDTRLAQRTLNLED